MKEEPLSPHSAIDAEQEAEKSSEKAHKLVRIKEEDLSTRNGRMSDTSKDSNNMEPNYLEQMEESAVQFTFNDALQLQADKFPDPALGVNSTSEWSNNKATDARKFDQMSRSKKDEPPARTEKNFELCVVCGDKASGRHYGAISCEGCKGFFKRSIRKQLGYACRGNRDCKINKHHRNQCQYCRLKMCFSRGMRSESVQTERKCVKYNSDHKTPVPIAPKPQRIYNMGVGVSDLSTLVDVAMKRIPVDLNNHSMSLFTIRGEESPEKPENEYCSRKAFDSMVKMAGCCANHVPQQGDPESDTLFELGGPLLLESHIEFNLTAPNPGSSFLNIHYICESGSRLLFLSLHWVRSIPAFQLLPLEVQSTLVQHCWSELFTLGMAQCSEVMSAKAIIAAVLHHIQSSEQQERLTPDRCEQVTEHLCKIQEFVDTMQRLEVDDHEYAYLKSIVLFSSDHPSLPRPRQIEKFQEKGYQELRNYIGQTLPESSDRFPMLLLKLRPLRSLLPAITEELFFSGLIGNVQIDSIIPYILNMDSSEYAPDMGSNIGSSGSANSEPSD